MSKTVKIPTYKAPYTVTINNNTYSYKPGSTMEVPDEVAEIIERDFALDIKAKPVGYSKIATVTVNKAEDGTLPSVVELKIDEDGKPFCIRDFFLTVTTKLSDSSATKAHLQIIGKNGDDVKCATGYALVDLDGAKEKKAWARFTTFGQDGNGGGLLTVGVLAIETAYGLYGTTTNYTGTYVNAAPTEPAVSLKEGMDKVSLKMTNAAYEYITFPEGTKIELWGVRI